MLNEGMPPPSPFIIAAAFAAAGAFVALQVTTPHTAACFTLIIAPTRCSNTDRRKKWTRNNAPPRGEKAVAELTLARHVENDDDTVSTSAVRACDCPETWL